MAEREGARVEFFKDSSHEWRFRAKGANNEITLQSEGYQNLTDCQATAAQFVHPALPWWEEDEEGNWTQLLGGENG